VSLLLFMVEVTPICHLFFQLFDRSDVLYEMIHFAANCVVGLDQLEICAPVEAFRLLVYQLLVALLPDVLIM